jgi:lipopolysaccharide biosynthesis glycosyltransferase
MNWLFLCVDDTYALPTAAALRSARAHLPEFARIMLVLNGVGATNRVRLARATEGLDVSWVDASEFDVDGLVGARHLSATTYLKLFADQALPSDAKRVLCIDGDVLVRAPLKPLFDIDLAGCPVAAARDMVISTRSHPYSGTGARDDRAYLNAGVLLLDLQRMRDGLGAALRSYAHDRPGVGNCDQDALNDVLDGAWVEIDPSWNVQGSLLLLHEHPEDPWVDEMRRCRRALFSQPRIVHFSGALKPWKTYSLHPFRRAWRDAVMSSGWFAKREAVMWRFQLESLNLAYEVLVGTGVRHRRERQTG